MAKRSTTDCSSSGNTAHATREFLQWLPWSGVWRELLEHLLHALRSSATPALCAVAASARAGSSRWRWPNLIAGQDVHDHSRSSRRLTNCASRWARAVDLLLRRRTHRRAAGVFRFVQIIVDLRLKSLLTNPLAAWRDRVAAPILPAGVMHPEPRLDFADGGAHFTGISRAEELFSRRRAFRASSQPIALLFQRSNFGAAMLGFGKQGL